MHIDIGVVNMCVLLSLKKIELLSLSHLKIFGLVNSRDVLIRLGQKFEGFGMKAQFDAYEIQEYGF